MESKSSITGEGHNKMLPGILKRPFLFYKVPHRPAVHCIKVDIKEASSKSSTQTNAIDKLFKMHESISYEACGTFYENVEIIFMKGPLIISES